MKIIRRAFEKLQEKPLLTCFIIAFILEMAVELLSRRSLTDFLRYHFTEPLMVLCNICVIMLTLSVAFLFRRRIFVFGLVSAAWIALGVTNCYLLSYRSAPLSMSDFYIIKAALGVFNLYVDKTQLILIILGASAIVTAIVLLYKKAPRQCKSAVHILPVVFCLMVSVVIAHNASFKVNAGEPSNYDELAEAYSDYGFAYCLSKSVIDTGMDRPEGYSEDAVKEIAAEISDRREEADGEAKANAGIKPNVIFLQLESFFDVNRLDGLTFSSDPTPIWNSLRKQYSSGYLTVPSIGAGTSRTEFEVLCSMDVSCFGLGECPYYTLLRDTGCEGMTSIMSENGYRTTAIHDNIASFYDRDLVYANLGFGDFISIEDMPDAEFNTLGWAKDKTILPYIEGLLSESPDKPDFIFGVTVQAHGRYPDDESYEADGALDVYGVDKEEGASAAASMTASLEYYINELREVDEFIGELIEKLEALGEPTILVMYGDHLPSLDYNRLSLKEGELNQTEYVIWDNIGLPRVESNLCSYRLSSYALKMAGIEGGTLNGLHNYMSNDADYHDMLLILEYDMLYN